MLTGDPGAALGALLLAALLDLLLGEPEALWRRVPHPVVLIGKLIEVLERRLYPVPPAPAVARRRGALLAALVSAAAVGAGLLLAAVARLLPAGWILEGCLMFTLLAWQSLRLHVTEVADALDRGLLPGRAAVARIVGRDPQSLDEPAVARAAIESLAENVSDGVVAPLLFGLLAGLPGMLVYKAINTLDSMVGHRSERYRDFGRASAQLDDLVNLVPARLSGLLIAISAMLMPDCDARAALAAMLRDAPHHRSPNAGWPEAAAAGSLGLRLAGPRRYGGRVVEDAWMGDGRVAVTAEDIRRALHLVGRSYALLLGALALGLLWLVA